MRLRPLIVAATVPVASAVVIALPSAAYAAPSISPANGSVYKTDTTVKIAATPDGNCDGSLSLQYPSGTTKQLASFSASFNPAPVSYSFATAGQDNGVYTVRVTEQQSPLCGGGSYASKFTLQIPGAAPQNLQATNLDNQTLQLQWSPASESGIVGYAVLNPDNGQSYVTDANGNPTYVSPSDASCGSGKCSLTLAFDPSSPTTYKFVVESERDCPGCAASPISSAPSNTASGTVQPPPPSPTPTTSGGSGGGVSGGGTSSGSPSPWPGGSSGSGGIHYTGGGTGSSSSKPAVVFHVGKGAPAVSGIALPGGEQFSGGVPTPFGTYNPQLPYPTTSVEDPVVSSPKDSGTLHSISSALGSPVSKRHLSRSIAAALVLLVMAAHIWAWAAAPSRD